MSGTGRLPVGLMGVTALWTAAHYRIPLLVIVANNQSFFNDEVHQERVARTRNRPIDNKWIGMRISDPDIDLAALAQAQGAQGFGRSAGTFERALQLPLFPQPQIERLHQQLIHLQPMLGSRGFEKPLEVFLYAEVQRLSQGVQLFWQAGPRQPIRACPSGKSTHRPKLSSWSYNGPRKSTC